MNRNVINVILEKKGSEQFNFGDELVGEICQVIWVNVGTQTMGYQVHFTPCEIMLSVVLRPEIGPERFCSQETKLIRDNLRIVGVKPDNSRVVKVLPSSTQDTPNKKNAFEMPMSSTPIQRPTSGIPKLSR